MVSEGAENGDGGGRPDLEDLHLPREVVARARREDLQAIWEKTEDRWSVDGEWAGKDPEEGGWIKTEEMI